MTQALLRNIDQRAVVFYELSKPLSDDHLPAGENVWAAEWSRELVAELNELGITIPSLMSISDYPGFYPQPRDCQRAMAEFDQTHWRYWNTSEMRTGKTAGTLWPTEAEMRWAGLKRVLILCPKSALVLTWQKEIMSIMPQVSAFYSTQPSTKATKEALLAGRHRIMVINYDKFWRCASEVQQWKPQKVIADEASECNDRRTKRARALRVLLEGKDDVRFVALTGTPLPNRPTDIWSINRFINPKTPPNYHQFEGSIMTPAYPGSLKLVAQPWAKQVVTELMQPNICFTTDSVADMPDHETVDVRVEMGKKQKKMFNEMRREFITEDKGRDITAQQAGSRLWKLIQIAAGVVLADDLQPLIVGAEPKLAMTEQLMREASGKAVIFVRYRAAQQYIMDKLGKKFNLALIHGDVPDDEQLAIFRKFQSGSLDGMVVGPDCVKYGHQFDRGSVNIWWHPVHSSLVYRQASARIRGTATGVSGKTTNFNLACNAFEEKIFQTVVERIAYQEDVKTGAKEEKFDELEMYKRLVLESLDSE